MVDNLKCS